MIYKPMMYVLKLLWRQSTIKYFWAVRCIEVWKLSLWCSWI